MLAFTIWLPVPAQPFDFPLAFLAWVGFDPSLCFLWCDSWHHTFSSYFLLLSCPLVKSCVARHTFNYTCAWLFKNMHLFIIYTLRFPHLVLFSIWVWRRSCVYVILKLSLYLGKFFLPLFYVGEMLHLWDNNGVSCKLQYCTSKISHFSWTKLTK